MKQEESFINKKRPAVEGLVEDVRGPIAQEDELVLGKPLPTEEELFKNIDGKEE